jgi:hypothetical protein
MRDLLSDTRYRTPGFHSGERDFHATPLRVRRTGKHMPGVATVQVIAQLAVAGRVMLLTIASSR